MRLHIADIDIETLEAEIGERLHLLRARNLFLSCHDKKRHAKRCKVLEKPPLLGKAAEGRAGRAVIGVEMDLDRERACLDGSLREVEIVTRERDDEREFAFAQRLCEPGFRI